jgi:seryl-tRNA synthetase
MATVISISQVHDSQVHEPHTDLWISPEGLPRLSGAAAALLWALDEKLRTAALLTGAEERRFPNLIAEEVLDRSEYFEAFPGCASRVTSPRPGDNYFLSPAVCYHCYDMLKNRTLANNIVFTCCGTCFRSDVRDGTHLWDFTMREVVFLGSAEFVQRQRERWMAKAAAFARSLDLDASLVPANDPFFGAGTRGRKLLQQLKQLKYELSIPLRSRGNMPIASFNLHERFFTERFQISLATGEPAHSGCVAFGLERWCMALLARQAAPAALARLEEHDDLR